ncbi:MAG TPA: phytanoyl-CoA dioxygenase family protein [Thermoanaerobaculia bacterium]
MTITHETGSRLDSSYALNAEQIAGFREQGCGVLRGVLSADEIEHYAPVVREYVQGVMRDGTGIDAALSRSATEREMRTSYHLDEAPPLVRELVTSPRLGEIAARLLGADAVRVLHFSGHFKPVGGQPTGWHQDLSYIPLDGDVVSIWIALSDVESNMSPLVFARGSHANRRLEMPDPRAFRMVPNPPMRPGDVSMHTGWTLHAALPNQSARQREAIAICYYADGARIDVSRRIPAMESFLNGCFAGLAPGDLAAGPQNPVVYRSANA